MSKDSEPSDWACLDSWWSIYTESKLFGQDPSLTQVLSRNQLTESWTELDSWWQAHKDTSPVVQGHSLGREFYTDTLVESWDELDPWWDIYTETGHDTVEQIANLLDQSNERWAQAPGPFDKDPLAADLTLEQISQGPLQPSNEMGWSRWLARLLRPSQGLMAELFGVDEVPEDIKREDPISGRRPDILVFHAERGVSIEVKQGDTHYQKTADTAELINDAYDDREWTHTLLISKGRLGRLRASVDVPVKWESDGQLQIEWNDPDPVSVIFWRDVTAAIRLLLRQGKVPDAHWAANAYLFCAVAEQQIMDFQPQPVVEQLTASANVVDTLKPIMIESSLDKQLTYLREKCEI